MCRLALDARVPAASKALLATAIAYFISPTASRGCDWRGDDSFVGTTQTPGEESMR